MEVADERGVPIAPSPAPPAHPRTPRVTRCTIILNQKAGSVVEASRAAVEASCARTGLDARIVAVPGPEIAAAAAQAAAAGDTLVAAGGDGTVSTVAAGGVRTRGAFRVIPPRALHHIARDARIPPHVHTALAGLAQRQLLPPPAAAV